VYWRITVAILQPRWRGRPSPRGRWRGIDGSHARV